MGEAVNRKDALEKEHGCSIENYIRGDAYSDYSICREERQYALFLYNILWKYRQPTVDREKDGIKNVFAVCGIPKEAQITNIFYEATLMRDFFERNRRIHWEGGKEKKLQQRSFSPSEGNKHLNHGESFNYKLIKYVYEDICGGEFPIMQWDEEENNLGSKCNKIKIRNRMREISDEKKNKILSRVQQMMNAKPDIAVVYEDGGRKYLLFLECKFESGESSYHKGDVRQCEIQGKIADYLCEYVLDEIEVSPFMKTQKGNRQYVSPVIQFVREKKESSFEAKEILISDLIRLNNEIFE